MKKTILAAFLLSAVLTSCKKNDKNCDLNQANFTGAYKTTSVKYKANSSSSEIDIFALSDACEKDDVITFNANGSYIVQDAGIKCSPPGDDNGTWSLSGSAINIDGEIGTVTYFDCKNATITLAGSAQGELTTLTIVKQ